MSEVKRYADAMIRGDIAVCEAIERQYNVYGFPPEFVSMTLSMVDALKERDALAAENERLNTRLRDTETERDQLKSDYEILIAKNGAFAGANDSLQKTISHLVDENATVSGRNSARPCSAWPSAGHCLKLNRQIAPLQANRIKVAFGSIRQVYATPLTFSTLRNPPKPSIPVSRTIRVSVAIGGGTGQPLTADTQDSNGCARKV